VRSGSGKWGRLPVNKGVCWQMPVSSVAQTSHPVVVFGEALLAAGGSEDGGVPVGLWVGVNEAQRGRGVRPW